jgi:hypothetical protein
MDYHPGVFVLGQRDVIAAWVVLVAFAAAVLLVDPGASAEADAAITAAQAKRHAPVATSHDALCSNAKAVPANHRG